MRTTLIALSTLTWMVSSAWSATATGAIPSNAQRWLAARTTAQQSASCIPAQPFYWEIGDARQALASGQAGSNAPTAHTRMALASASKWLYSAYVAERRNGQLLPEDVLFLNFESGYTRFHACSQDDTVGSCATRALNGYGLRDWQTFGKFDYNGGHMQKHATLMGLGGLDNAALAQAMTRTLGMTSLLQPLTYNQPQLAGGAETTADTYGRFLQKILQGDLKMAGLLGSHPVCTNPTQCPDKAVSTPIPLDESWHYSVGHWVEDDPKVGDGAFSSPGAFGFYPWIDANRQFYGILAREDHQGAGDTSDPTDRPAIASVHCGRQIRAAWISGQVQN